MGFSSPHDLAVRDHVPVAASRIAMNQSRIGLANPSCPCSVAERCHWPHRFSRRPDKLCYRNLIKVQRPTRLRPGAIVFIGKNSRGKWVAKEQHGLFGGLFISRAQAVKYALFENGHHPETIVEVSREIEPDMGDRSSSSPLQPARHTA